MEQTSKRVTSIFIPYKRSDKRISVFLQRRTKDAKILPDYFAFFGGKIEDGETPEAALIREAKEELNLDLKDFRSLRAFEFERWIMNVFYSEVDENFDKIITVLEGQYGKWFTEEEVQNEKMMTQEDKSIVYELLRKIEDNL